MRSDAPEGRLTPDELAALWDHWFSLGPQDPEGTGEQLTKRGDFRLLIRAHVDVLTADLARVEAENAQLHEESEYFRHLLSCLTADRFELLEWLDQHEVPCVLPAHDLDDRTLIDKMAREALRWWARRNPLPLPAEPASAPRSAGELG